MTTENTFVIAGFTKSPAGVKTFRFSNGQLNLRVNMLRCKGHENINLVEMPKPMTQLEAMTYVLANVKGSKGSVIATRAAKQSKSELVIEAELRASKLLARRAAKTAKSEAVAA